ncbi:hypothetical protein KUCAC02_034795, partial [Chaenocephalus aceratus]
RTKGSVLIESQHCSPSNQVEAEWRTRGYPAIGITVDRWRGNVSRTAGES